MFDGEFMYGPIAVFPKTVLSWRVLTSDDITPEALELFLLLQPKLDVLIIGAGDHKYVDKVRRKVAPILSKNRIGFEVMSTVIRNPSLSLLNYCL